MTGLLARPRQDKRRYQKGRPRHLRGAGGWRSELQGGAAVLYTAGAGSIPDDRATHTKENDDAGEIEGAAAVDGRMGA